MKIDQLPVEILMKIFSYLGRYNNVSLVNKQFYDVACKVNDSNVCLTIDYRFFDQDLQLLQSIQNTNRKITKVRIRIGNPTKIQLRSAISVIEKFSATIKCLICDSIILEMSEFLEILSLVPNAENLDLLLIQLKTDNEPQPQHKHRMMPSYEDLNLHQLKTLEVEFCRQEFSVVFNRLPAGVLTELLISHQTDYLHKLNVLFKRQSNIKKVTIQLCNFRTVDLDILDNLRLESLKLLDHGHYNVNIATILSKQTELKSLKLLRSSVDDSLMNFVTNQLTELETFSIDVSKITVAAFANLKNLKKLKDLTLKNDRNENMAVFESFANLNNSGIITLDIQSRFNMPVDLIHALAGSVPNLKVLRFHCYSYYFMTTFEALLIHFNFVEVLHFECHGQHNDNRNLIKLDCFNPKLIELKIDYALPLQRPFLQKLFVDYPNLKRLVMRSSTPLTASQFKLILNGFTKMESLTLVEGASKLTIDDLDCLKDHKNNLKFISLCDSEVAFTVEIKRKLSALFDVVRYRFGNLAMAVDRNTLQFERHYTDD